MPDFSASAFSLKTFSDFMTGASMTKMALSMFSFYKTKTKGLKVKVLQV